MRSFMKRENAEATILDENLWYFLLSQRSHKNIKEKWTKYEQTSVISSQKNICSRFFYEIYKCTTCLGWAEPTENVL